MASELYEASEQLEALARQLIQKNHGHLIEANIKYLFRTGNWEAKKRETWGNAKKVGKEMNFLTGYDFIITIHRDVWDQLNGEEREALIDHELQHCCAGTDDAGNKVWYIQGHDFEDFFAIIERHGIWSRALRKLEGILNQTELEFSPPEMQEEDLLGLPAAPMQLKEGRPRFALIQGKTSSVTVMDTEGAEINIANTNTEIIDAEIIDETDEVSFEEALGAKG